MNSRVQIPSRFYRKYSVKKFQNPAWTDNSNTPKANVHWELYYDGKQVGENFKSKSAAIKHMQAECLLKHTQHKETYGNLY